MIDLLLFRGVWILFLVVFCPCLFPAGLGVPLLYSLSVIDCFFLRRCLLIVYYILFFIQMQNCVYHVVEAGSSCGFTLI